MAAGGRHTLALLADGTVRAWGANETGQLGDGTTTLRRSPVAVQGLTWVLAIAAGEAHSLALKSDGTIVAWGLNAFGQLGDGTTTNRTAPVAVTSLGSGVGLIAAGANHSLAVKAGGVLYAWGNNSNSQLGTGNNANQATPQLLSAPTGVTSVAGGSRHTAAITTARRLFVWGDNFFGQVGNRSGNYNPHSASLNVLRGDSLISSGTGSSGSGVGTGSNSGSSVLEIDGQQTVFDFGQIGQGTSRSIGGKYKNASATQDVTGVGVSVTGSAFALAGSTCPGALTPDKECTFTIGFNPGAATTYNGELVVQSSVVGSPERRSLVGTGLAPATASIAFAAGGVDFPPQSVGAASAAAAYTLTNSGTAALSIGGISSNLADFAASHNCNAVAAGGSCTISVVFTPSTTGTRTALLSGTSNASGSPHSVTVSGTGAPATPSGLALTIARAGAGSGTVSSVPAGLIDCGSTCTASVPAGTSVTLTATPAAGSTFAGWSSPCSGTGTCSVTMQQSQTITATFNSISHTLTVTRPGSGGGSVASTSPAGAIDCGSTCSASLAQGTTVTLTATPAAGSTFAGWADACTGIGPCEVTMTGPKNVNAAFALPSQFALSVARTGSGTGTVTSTFPASPSIACGTTCIATYASDTVVTLAAAAGVNSTFTGWSGACSGTGACNVTMSQARSVTATFAAQASLGLSATALDFGGQSMGTTSPALALTLTNSGSGSLTISSITISTQQFSQTNNCSSLAAGASCTVQVLFHAPIAPGTLGTTLGVTATLAVSTSAGSGNVSLAGTAEKSLVAHYYRSILGRAPDAGGNAFWQSEALRIAALGVSVNEAWFAMSLSFFNSVEYSARNTSDTQYITDLYRTFFARDPDAAGLAFWQGYLNQEVDRGALLTNFLFSQEFANFTGAIFGTTPVRAEINMTIDLYRGILGVLPDSGGFAFWLGQIRAAQCQGAAAIRAKVGELAGTFVSSAEYGNREAARAAALRTKMHVGDLYNAFLRRGVAPRKGWPGRGQVEPGILARACST